MKPLSEYITPGSISVSLGRLQIADIASLKSSWSLDSRVCPQFWHTTELTNGCRVVNSIAQLHFLQISLTFAYIIFTPFLRLNSTTSRRRGQSQTVNLKGGNIYLFSYSGTAAGKGVDPSPARGQFGSEKPKHRGYVGERIPQAAKHHPAPLSGGAGMYRQRTLHPRSARSGQRVKGGERHEHKI